MNWTSFNILGKVYCVKHLSAYDLAVTIDGSPVTLHITFGHHCFTDEKQYGPMIFKTDERYFSPERYDLSIGLPALINKNFIDSYAIPYINRKSNEQYHYMEMHGYAIFFDINKPSGTTDKLKVKIVSAYEVDEWGRDSLPKGKPRKIRWILSRRLDGGFVL